MLLPHQPYKCIRTTYKFVQARHAEFVDYLKWRRPTATRERALARTTRVNIQCDGEQ